MGDPLSVTASTAGILSFGIQVCSGLISYCKAWKSHDREIERVLGRLEELNATIGDLKSVFANAESLDHGTGQDLDGPRQRIQSCTAALRKLHSTLLEVESITNPSGILDKVHNIRLRSMALFNKEKLQGVSISITEIQSNVHGAMHLLGLNFQFEQKANLENLVMEQKRTNDQLRVPMEEALVHLFESHGRQLRAFQDAQTRSTEASLQHSQDLKRLTETISSWQLQLIQKPGLIKSTYERQIEMQSPYTSQSPRRSQQCRCRPLTNYRPLMSTRYLKSSEPRHWSAGTFRKTWTHRQDCPLFGRATKKQFGSRFSYCGWLLNGTVEAVLSIKFGPGGSSISPKLNFIPTVPSNTGAFKIMWNFWEKLRHGWRIIYHRPAFLEDIVFSVTHDLKQIYQGGRQALPADMDEEGNNVMHVAFQILQNICKSGALDDQQLQIFFQLFVTLQELGTPLNGANESGLTPLGILMRADAGYLFGIFCTMSKRLVNRIHDLGAEFSLFTLENSAYKADILDRTNCAIATYCSMFHDLAEAYGCNEISQAIVADSLEWLLLAIRRKPESINEPNILGQTALHFSVVRPEIVRALLDADADANARDCNDLSPIFYAVKLGYADSVKILEESGCDLGRSDPSQQTLLEIATMEETHVRPNAVAGPLPSQHCFDAVVALVVQRLHRLAKLASFHLSSHTLDQLQPDRNKVLDRQSTRICSLLSEKIELPVWMKGLTRPNTTVYHMSSLNKRQACLLWDFGFRDVTEYDGWGIYPLMVYRDWSLRRSSEYFQILEWLISHGADIHSCQVHTIRQQETESEGFYVSDVPSTLQGVHYAATEILVNLRSNTTRNTALIQLVLKDPATDGCKCACSVGGCTPLTMGAKQILRFTTSSSFKASVTIARFLEHFLRLQAHPMSRVYRDLIRVSTFKELGLRHTCCSYGHSKLEGKSEVGSTRGCFIYEVYDDEEASEIMEEQKEQIELLETLLPEFYAKYDELGLSLSNFLKTYWIRRIREALKQTAPHDDDALKNLGVRLIRARRRSSIYESCMTKWLISATWD